MSWTIEGSTVDDELKQKMKDKIDDSSFGAEDLKDYFTLFVQIANSNSDVKDEIDGFNRKFQFKIDGFENAWMKLDNQTVSMGSGEIADPDITLEMNARTTAGIFTGEIDATSAYMGGDLKITGALPDAVKFRTITELVREALD